MPDAPMFPNWTGWKWVKLTLFVLIGLDGWALTVSKFGPVALDWLHVLAGLLGTLGGMVTVLSGTNAGPTIARVGAKVATMALSCFLALAVVVMPGYAIGGIVTAGAVVGMVGCGLLQPQAPTESQVERVIVADLEAGKTKDQIVQDVAALYVKQPGVDIVRIVLDALALLGDTGVLAEHHITEPAHTLTVTLHHDRAMLESRE